MNELRKAKYKDEILQYLYEERRYAIAVSDIARVVTKKALTSNEVMDLCHEIIDYDPELLSETMMVSKVAFRANENTLYFLDNSSFTEMIKQGIRKEKFVERKQREREDKEDGYRELQAENTKLNNRLTKQKLKSHWIPIAISILGLCVAVASFFRPSNNFSQEQMNTKIESLEVKLKQLNNGLKKENESLSDELYKAQILIEIYESDTIAKRKV